MNKGSIASLAIIFGCLCLLFAAWNSTHTPTVAQPDAATAAIAPTHNIESKDYASTVYPDPVGASLVLLQRSRSAETDLQAIHHLVATLHSLGPDKATAAMQTLLDSKVDVSTRLSLTLSSKGSLAGWPSLRVLLLDYLGQINPYQAYVNSLTVFQTSNSADEWAVALRNCTSPLLPASSRDVLRNNFAALLAREDWSKDPSNGYLEAFDIAPFLGGTNFVIPLSSFLREKKANAVAHAAYLSLDRLVISDPVGVLGLLVSDRSILDGRELTRASYFARIDARDPRQRAILERYLLDSNLSGQELDRFIDLFPNQNYMVSHNLATDCATPDSREVRSRDLASIIVIEHWLQDARFKPIEQQLLRSQARLQRFTGTRLVGGK